MLEACLTWPGLPGAEWVPTQAWSPPGRPTENQLGHSGLCLSLRVPWGLTGLAWHMRRGWQ